MQQAPKAKDHDSFASPAPGETGPGSPFEHEPRPDTRQAPLFINHGGGDILQPDFTGYPS